MPTEPTPNSDQAYIDATREIWDQNAAFWDEQMGEGNQFQRLLVGPAAERLLAIEPGEHVLELACGNGQFARRLAALGASVLACDVSENMIRQARQRPSPHADRIAYQVVDATDEARLVALGERRFDAVVCNMALMDIPVIDPLLRGVARVLKPNGRFVFTQCHPCFNHTNSRHVVEQEDREGEIVVTYGVKIVGYLHTPPRKGLAIIGQPQAQWYFDRPLQVIFNACFRAGFVVDGLEEPEFPPEEKATNPLGWVNFRDIPPVLAVRLRLR